MTTKWTVSEDNRALLSPFAFHFSDGRSQSSDPDKFQFVEIVATLCLVNETMIKLKYGNTNTFFIPGRNGGLLVDTDYAGTLPTFYKEIKKNGIRVNDIEYVLATHYHPDHMGLISELMKQGVKLLLVDVQQDTIHLSDAIFARDGLPCEPIKEENATILSCEESRAFLLRMGISGEIIYTPSHSDDSISVVLDDGNCIVGDLEPIEHLAAYEANTEQNNEIAKFINAIAKLKSDWKHVLSFQPKRIYYAHAPEKVMGE